MCSVKRDILENFNLLFFWTYQIQILVSSFTIV